MRSFSVNHENMQNDVSLWERKNIKSLRYFAISATRTLVSIIIREN